MPSPMTTAGYPDLVTDLDIKFQAHLETTVPDMVSKFYTLEPWTNGDPKKMTFQTYALPMYGKRTGEGDPAAKYSPTMGNQLEKEFFKYAMSTDYTIEMDKFDSEATRDQMAASFAQSLKNNKELEMTHQLLTYADTVNYQPMDLSTTTSFATPDGLAPGSASHTVPGTGATTYSNILADADPLSPDAITELIAQLQTQTVNDEGKIVPLNFDTLVISDDFEVKKRAFEILGSNLVPYEESNTYNIYSGGKANGKLLNLMVLNRGIIGRDGASAGTRRFHWAVMASETFGANKYSTGPGAGVEKVGASVPNALYGIMAYQFAVFCMTRWQGKGYSFATSL